MNIPSAMTMLGFAAQQKLASRNEKRRRSCIDAETAYYGDREGLKQLVADELKRVSSVNPSKVPLVALRIVKRLIGTMAMVYKQPATRAAGTAPEGGALSPGAQAYADILKASDIRQAAPRWDAMGRLHNCVLVRPIFHAAEKRWEFRIYTPANSDVEPDPSDYLRMKTVQYYRTVKNALGLEETEVVEWTADTALAITRLGTAPLPGLPDKRNPYGEIPFAVLRLEDQGDFWGEGATDLVDTAITFLAQYAALLDNSLAQSFSILLAINAGLTRKQTLKSEQGVGEAAKVDLGARSVLTVDVKNGDPLPSLEYVTPEPLLEELTTVLNHLLQVVCWTYGLSAARVVNLMTGGVADTEQSGVAKSLDNADLEELREKHIESYRSFERDLYRVTKLVAKHDAKVELPPVEEFTVDFAELVVKKTFGEIKDERDHLIDMNLSNPAKFAREMNPDLGTDEAALEFVRENAAINEELATTRVIRDALQTG